MTLVHRQQNIINEKLYKEQNDDKVPVMIIPDFSDKSKNKKKEKTKLYGERKKGKLFYISREAYECDQKKQSSKELTLAYANMIHCFQGKTLSKGKLYIYVNNYISLPVNRSQYMIFLFKFSIHIFLFN